MTEPAPSTASTRRIITNLYHLELTETPIDAAQLIETVRTPACGAVVTFLGTVREMTAGRRTQRLSYQSYPEMALQELKALVEEMLESTPVERAGVIHRLGRLELGEIAIGLAVSAPHRAEAFQAAAELMDCIKQSVPIWKQEHWDDGTSDWIHPAQDETR